MEETDSLVSENIVFKNQEKEKRHFLELSTYQRSDTKINNLGVSSEFSSTKI